MMEIVESCACDLDHSSLLRLSSWLDVWHCYRMDLTFLPASSSDCKRNNMEPVAYLLFNETFTFWFDKS